jgi:raffinose/stachyose/melibiose transport system permease protein
MESRREVTLVHALLIVASIAALYPLVSILLLAINEPGARVSGFTIPDGIHLDNFATAWTEGRFGSAIVSSAIVAISVVVAVTVVSTLAGYAFGVLNFPGRSVLFWILLVGLVLPYEGMLIPLYYMMKDWGLLDSYAAMILPQIGLSVSFGIYWMRSFFASAPRELIDAGRVDGATGLQTLRLVLLPLARPAILALAALVFLFAWNEFLLALVMVPTNADAQTAPLSLSFFAGNRRNFDAGVVAAAALLVALPVLIGYVLLQRQFIRGIAEGAVKG